LLIWHLQPLHLSLLLLVSEVLLLVLEFWREVAAYLLLLENPKLRLEGALVAVR